MSEQQALKALNNRVWYVEGGIHPSRPPEFLALGKFSGDPGHSIGEAARISAPDPNNFNRDIQIGTVEGSEERATFSVATRYTAQAAILMALKNKGCPIDFFALTGRCGNPQDFTEGGEKWVYFPDGRISSHGLENFGAFSRDENNPTNETVDVTSETYYEFLNMKQEQIGASVTSRLIYTVDVYTGNDCEACPDPCDRVLATMAGTGATPGTKPILLYSADGGISWLQETITTLFSTEAVADAEVIGGDLVLISNASHSFHYTNIDDVYNENNTWSEQDEGFVIGKGPNAMSSADVRHTWVVGDGGYIYFAKNHKVGVEVQDAGVTTTQVLNSVHAFDTKSVLVVGNSNAVLFTDSGGEIWKSVTGPAVGVNMGACWMWSETVWFVGEGAGGTGKLWLTVNAGVSWEEVGLPATYLRFRKILFVSAAEGYLIADDGGQSYVLRTITAGNEWVVLPQGKTGVAVINSYLNDLAVCSKFANTAFAGGLADDGTSGIILKMAA